MRCPTDLRLCQTSGMPVPHRPLLVLDSASLYYRAFYALPEKMTAPDGRPHNAIRGFLTTVTRLVDLHGPRAIVACWDNDWRPEWRVELIASYKTHRVADPQEPGAAAASEAEPESLGPQAEAIAEFLDSVGIPRWGRDGYEADDVIGSVTTQALGPCVVVSGDRDLVQLIDASTWLHLTVNGGMDKWPMLDADAALTRFGVLPERYVDVAVLRGDPSDGLPGVPGIGAKTAVALVVAFGDLEGILAAATDATPTRPMTPRLAQTLKQNADLVRRARQVTSVVRDLPLPGVVPSVSSTPVDPERLAALTEQWGVQRQVADLEAALRRQTDAE